MEAQNRGKGEHLAIVDITYSHTRQLSPVLKTTSSVSFHVTQFAYIM